MQICLVITNVNSEDICLDMDLQGVKGLTECKIIKDGMIWENHEFNGEIPAESVIFIKFVM